MPPLPLRTDPNLTYRRRIVLEPGPGTVFAEMEDNPHHVRIRIEHSEGIIRHVEVETPRLPWTTCPAGAQAARQMEGLSLAAASDPDTWASDRSQHCLHEFDLAHLAVRHVHDTVSSLFQAVVRAPGRPEREAWLYRDGEQVMHWQLEETPPASHRTVVAGPGEYSGLPLQAGFTSWIARLDPRTAEHATILRRACHISGGLAMDLDLADFAGDLREADGSCYSYSAGIANIAARVRGSTLLSLDGPQPF